MTCSNQPMNECKECKRIQTENDHLKKLIQYHLPNVSFIPEAGNAKMESAALQKVRLFQSLFKGRTDVYAIRKELMEGKFGYLPATITGAHKPLSDQDFYDHLSGKQTIGIYPLLPDNTSWFLAADFDKNQWQEDVRAFAASCKYVQLPYHIERSRSGNGAHVWIFFSDAIPAILARQLGKALLEHA